MQVKKITLDAIYDTSIDFLQFDIYISKIDTIPANYCRHGLRRRCGRGRGPGAGVEVGWYWSHTLGKYKSTSSVTISFRLCIYRERVHWFGCCTYSVPPIYLERERALIGSGAVPVRDRTLV